MSLIIRLDVIYKNTEIRKKVQFIKQAEIIQYEILYGEYDI